jgi:1,4-dihydroxy-2-naphthoate polyprenyltransferase
MNLFPYILAARPKTLPAAIVPVWLGCVLAFNLSGKFDGWLAFYTMMGALWIQIGTNFFNDAIDSDKGADTEKRLGPRRATASGMISRRLVYASAILCLILAGIFGCLLFQARGWMIIVLGVPSLYLCYGYTGGPWPLAYKGMGELFVVLFFGLLSAVLISINNLRDREEDEGNNKRTMAVQLGEKIAKRIFIFEIFLPALIGIIWLKNDINLAIYPLVYVLIAIPIARGVTHSQPGRIYNKYLALAGAQLILFAAAFHIAAFSF